MLTTCLLFSGGRAEASWGEPTTANIMKQMLEEAYTNFQKVILTGIKQAANETIIGQMRKLAAGTTGQPSVIADYEDFIFGSVRRNVDVHVTDFFRMMQTGGVSEETRSELRMAETAIRNELEPSMASQDMFEYRINSPTPRQDVFNQALGGGAEEYLAMQMSGSHPVDIFFQAQNKIAAKVEQEEEAQKTKLIAGSGFDTAVSGNKVVPGAVMKDLLVAAETMPMEMINNAGSWQEVVATMAVKAVSSFVKTGINVVSRPVENQVRRINRTVDEGVSGVLKDIYSGSGY